MGDAESSRPARNHPARGGHRAVHRHSLRSVPCGGRAGEIAPGRRIWLHVGGVRMFGPGTHELLHHVAATGSLHQAAQLMDMSYTKAWRLLRKTEEHLGGRLLERQVGGAAGGGSSLTPMGRELVRRFDAFLSETDAAMLSAFDRAFAGWPGDERTERRDVTSRPVR